MIGLTGLLLAVALSIAGARVMNGRLNEGDAGPAGAIVGLSITVVSFQLSGLAAILLNRALPLTAIAVAIQIVALVVLLRLGKGQPWLKPRWMSGAMFLVPASVVALAYAATVFIAYRAGVQGWDSAWFHVPLPIRWIQTGTLGDPYHLASLVRDTPNFGMSPGFNPANANFFHMMFVQAFGKDGSALTQMPFAFLGSYMVGSLASRLGADRTGQWAAALTYLSAPIVLIQSATPYSDVINAALCLGALYLTVSWWIEPRPLHPLVTGLAFGLVLGAKLVSFPFVVILGTASLVVGLLHLERRIAATGAFVFGVLLPGSFWAVRNWILVGSPLYPVELRLGSRVIFQGTNLGSDKGARYIGHMDLPEPLAWLVHPFNEFINEESGMGPALVALGITGLILGLLAIKGPSRRWVLLPFLASLSIAAWWTTRHDPRHTIVTLGLLAACVPLTLSAFSSLRAPWNKLCLLASAGLIGVSALFGAAHLYRQRPPTPAKGNYYCGVETPKVQEALEALPDGSLILNDLASGTGERTYTCNLAVSGPSLENRVLWELSQYLPPTPREATNRLKELGVDYVFLKIQKEASPPRRFAQLMPVKDLDVRRFRVVILQVPKS